VRILRDIESFDDFYFGPNRTGQNATEIGRVSGIALSGPNPEMEMEMDFSLEIAISDPETEPILLPGLVFLRNAVGEILDRFAPEFL
jgi:hypothetical protein